MVKNCTSFLLSLPLLASLSKNLRVLLSLISVVSTMASHCFSRTLPTQEAMKPQIQ